MNITSINVDSQLKIAPICDDFIAELSPDGQIFIKTLGCFYQSQIYISNLDAYSNTCNTFGNTLYHEIGHADRFSKFGEAPNIQIDEDYADNYSNNFTKDKCDNIKFKNLEVALKEKENAYNDSLNVLSKWNRFSCSSCDEIQPNTSFDTVRPLVCVYRTYSCGVPRELYSEYQVDYKQYTKSIAEYNDIINKMKIYLNDPSSRIYSQE